MGIRLRRRDGSCLETGVRGNGEVIDDSEEVPITTFRGGRGRGYGRRGGRGRGGGRGRRYD